MKNLYFTALKCNHCKQVFKPTEDLLLCPSCKNLLDPQYDYKRLKDDWNSLKIEQRANNIWRYRELLPVLDFDKIVTLGEGGAPLLDCPELAEELGISKFYILNDAGQPTGSLKDRSIAVTATKAKEFGYNVLSCDSTGNKAASTAGYAARAGMKSIVFCPYETPIPKITQALFYGAYLVRMEGHYSEINSIYREMIASRRYPWYDCGTDNPFRYEGKKTYAYEIAQGLNWNVPTHILQPAAGGMSVVKTWKGFNELKYLGLIGTLPRMVACQSMNCGPIVNAIKSGNNYVPEVTKKYTIASALAVSNPGLLGNETLRAVVASNGYGVHVEDDALLNTWKRLGQIGIFCEPSSAIAVASAYKLAEQGVLKCTDILVAVVTGSGFKDTDILNKNVEIPINVVKGREEFFITLDKFNESCKL